MHTAGWLKPAAWRGGPGRRAKGARQIYVQRKNMFKRIAFTVLLALQFAAIADLSKADVPWPQCYPCPDSAQPR